MTTEKKYKIVPPVGNIITSKEWMTAKELREFALQILESDDDYTEVWKEKIEKDEVENVIKYLTDAGYGVIEV